MTDHATERWGPPVAEDDSPAHPGGEIAAGTVRVPGRVNMTLPTGTNPPDSHERRTVRILVVEDDPDTLDLYTLCLERDGFDVVRATSAFEALTHARTQAIDLVVSDIGLPGGDGFALLKALRGLRPDLADVPAIAITALKADDDIDAAYRAGYLIHASKPIDASTLLQLVRAVADPPDDEAIDTPA